MGNYYQESDYHGYTVNLQSYQRNRVGYWARVQLNWLRYYATELFTSV